MPPINTEQPPIRILFVDDKEDIRYLFSVGMRSDHIHLDAVGNGEEALKALSRQAYDLVITDVRMPVMDGITLLK